MTPAGVGSWFKYRTSTIDTLTGQALEIEYMTESIIATGLHYADKSNVSEIMKDDTTDLAYLAYEVNGDLSVRDTNYSTTDSEVHWSTLPLSTRGTTSYRSIVRPYTIDYYTYDGEETVALAHTLFHTIRIKWAQRRDHDSSTEEQTIWFARETGSFVKSNTPVYTINGNKKSGWNAELIEYVLK